MPARIPAAIYVQADRPYPDKQEAVCHAHAEENRLRPTALCFHPPDCVALVRSGAVQAVITAIDPGEDFAEQVAEAGGELVVVRETRTRVRREVSALVVRMFRKGMDVPVIADILSVDTGDIRRSLRRAGIRPE